MFRLTLGVSKSLSSSVLSTRAIAFLLPPLSSLDTALCFLTVLFLEIRDLRHGTESELVVSDSEKDLRRFSFEELETIDSDLFFWVSLTASTFVTSFKELKPSLQLATWGTSSFVTETLSALISFCDHPCSLSSFPRLLRIFWSYSSCFEPFSLSWSGTTLWVSIFGLNWLTQEISSFLPSVSTSWTFAESKTFEFSFSVSSESTPTGKLEQT